jgi:hypothetical protein
VAGFLSLARAAVCYSCFFLLASTSRSQMNEQLVPTRFQQVKDAPGFRWDSAPNRAISDGSNDWFDGGVILLIKQS